MGDPNQSQRMGSDHYPTNKREEQINIEGKKKRSTENQIFSFRFKVELCWTPQQNSHKNGKSLKEFFSRQSCLPLSLWKTCLSGCLRNRRGACGWPRLTVYEQKILPAWSLRHRRDLWPWRIAPITPALSTRRVTVLHCDATAVSPLPKRPLHRVRSRKSECVA